MAESKTARYAPACAFAELLVRHGPLLEATNLVNETEAEAAFNQETARTYGEHPERRNDLEDFATACQEFFLNAGGPEDIRAGVE